MLACDGEQVGTVDHVVAAPEQDIFHGLVIDATRLRQALRRGRGRGLAARTRASTCGSTRPTVAALPAPGGGAPVYDEDPAESAGLARTGSTS